MDARPFEKMYEAAYLTAERAWSYRAILRYFYLQHERLRKFLFPEEIFQHLKQRAEFHDYTEEQLEQDLWQLERWNNLIARQEMSDFRTVEEFKKKRFRYECSPATIEIERMLIRLEKMGDQFQGSLERTQFTRLSVALQKIKEIVIDKKSETDEECAQIWDDLVTYFRTITENTSDYIAYIHSEQVEEKMKTKAFLVYKDRFTSYLRDFIISLQKTALTIQYLLETIDKTNIQPFLKQVARHRKSVPRLDDVTMTGENLFNQYLETWRSLRAWFLGDEGRESEFTLLQAKTNEMIRRITRVVQRLGERSHQVRSRKSDYLHLARWFSKLEKIEEAHKLSAVAFGVFRTQHIFSDHVPGEDLYKDVWNETPVFVHTRPRVRHYREKMRPSAIKNEQEKKKALLQQYLEELKREQQVIEQYLHGKAIHLRKLPVIEPAVRKRLLSWIGRAMNQQDGIIKTEFGERIRVELRRNDSILLRATDGELRMPDAMIQFLDRGDSHAG